MPTSYYTPIKPSPPNFAGGRFKLEVFDHSGAFVVDLPYLNMQGEWFLNEQGEQLRFSVPYRSVAKLTSSKLIPGKHEVWLWDKAYSSTIPIFQGPIIDAVVSSSDGLLNVSAAGYLWYFSKRVISSLQTFSSVKPESIMSSLLTYTNGVRNTRVVASTPTAGTTNISQTYRAPDRVVIADAWSDLAGLGDGVDYYMRYSGSAPTLYLYGGKKKTTKTFVLEYHGTMKSYAFTTSALGMANQLFLRGNTGIIGSAADSTSQSTYDALYEKVDSANLTAKSSLNTAAATRIKTLKNPKQIPQIIAKSDYFDPFVDLDLGDQMLIVIDDYYVQYSGTSRIVGWQLSFGANDEITTVFYLNDLNEVT